MHFQGYGQNCDTLCPSLALWSPLINIETQHYRFGTAKANEDEVTIWMVPLYIAAKVLHPETPTWPDMEFLIQRQMDEHLFVCGRPRTLSQCYSKFVLSRGLSTQHFSKNLRELLDKKKPRLDGSISFRFLCFLRDLLQPRTGLLSILQALTLHLKRNRRP